MTSDASDEWKQWQERRVETVSAPYGPLALTGTHWPPPGNTLVAAIGAGERNLL